MNIRRKYLQNSLCDKSKITDSLLLEAVIRMAFHDDKTPRDFSPVELREMLLLHPQYDLIMEEGVDSDHLDDKSST